MGKIGGGGPLSWEGVAMVVVCGEVFGWAGRFFNKNVQYKVGVGDRVKLWKDRWCGDLPLNLAYPILYNFAANREASV